MNDYNSKEKNLTPEFDSHDNISLNDSPGKEIFTHSNQTLNVSKAAREEAQEYNRQYINREIYNLKTEARSVNINKFTALIASGFIMGIVVIVFIYLKLFT